MIERFLLKKDLKNLIHFLNTDCKENSTFYYTEDYKRVYPKKKEGLIELFDNSIAHFIERDTSEDIKGVILLWRGLAGEVQRNYVKLSVVDNKTAENLLTVLLWNTNKELFAKLHKNSELIKVFNKKGFRFFRGRGTEVLLRRPQYVNNFDKHRDKSTESNRRYISKQ